MKSDVSTLLRLACCVYEDAAAKCTATTPDVRDLKTIRSRVEKEGLSFLTITLPSFGADLERSLHEEAIDPTLFRSFKKSGRVPAFLQGFLGHIFDIGTGKILADPSVTAVEGVRQIAYTFKKLNLMCSVERVQKAITNFAKDERIFDEPLATEDVDLFNKVASQLWGKVLLAAPENPMELIPKHGPGATAERIMGNQKFVFRSWHERLESYFPVLDFAFSTYDARLTEGFEKLTFVTEDEEEPVKVTPVPKTLKGPRIIAIEPVCMQYTQQALSKALVKVLESDAITGGHINFSDQSINRRLAMRASKSGSMATLDLSSASDRVPRDLALSMFNSKPFIRDAIDACRSKRAKLPTGEILALKKFASMGSALCFPVEAMYFYTICVAALIRKYNLPVTLPSIRKVGSWVYVYGDDIVVPAHDAVEVAEHLHKYYCKVNVSKSFWKGTFRESCGMDAFAGEPVTPTYLRQVPPRDLRNVQSIISWVKTSNLLYKRGYWLTAHYMQKCVEAITGTLPVVGSKCAGLGWESFMPAVSINRWGKRYQRPEVRTWVATPVYRKDKLEGYPALLKSLLNLEVSKTTLSERKHLQESARYGAVTLKRRWISPV